MSNRGRRPVSLRTAARWHRRDIPCRPNMTRNQEQNSQQQGSQQQTPQPVAAPCVYQGSPAEIEGRSPRVPAFASATGLTSSRSSWAPLEAALRRTVPRKQALLHAATFRGSAWSALSTRARPSRRRRSRAVRTMEPVIVRRPRCLSQARRFKCSTGRRGAARPLRQKSFPIDLKVPTSQALMSTSKAKSRRARTGGTATALAGVALPAVISRMEWD